MSQKLQQDILMRTGQIKKSIFYQLLTKKKNLEKNPLFFFKEIVLCFDIGFAVVAVLVFSTESKELVLFHLKNKHLWKNNVIHNNSHSNYL